MSGNGVKVAVATTSTLAADAAAEVADLGGNAVDCAIAAALSSINTQPGVCALPGSAFVTVLVPGHEPVTIDGNVTIPGLGAGDFVPDPVSVSLEYGGGVETLVGASSVAVPGTLAALHMAANEYGRCRWRDLFTPTIRAARDGFPFATACHYFLGYAGHSIYGRSDDGFRAIHHEDGTLRALHSNIVVPHLADTLQAIADEGRDIFYAGEIGARIADHVQSRGGLLTREDLLAYQPLIRPALAIREIAGWRIATNPPPAIGGAALAAMLLAFGTDPVGDWDHDAVRRLIRAQEATYRFRGAELDPADDVLEPVTRMLTLASSGELLSKYASASTVHTSAVDNCGMACSITASSGYGSGEMPEGTGLWLNNCLGELELNRRGLKAGPPGKRLPSNMAPSVARSEDGVLAIGSPGADRITTALHQLLVNFVQRGLDLARAVAHPRLHLKIDEDGAELAVEPGLDVPATGLEVTRYPELSMYFGGVAAAHYSRRDGFSVAADPRREGGTFVGPKHGEQS